MHESHDRPARYCLHCGSELQMQEAFGRVRPCCSACGHIHFEDPKVAVGVVAERDGGILLTRRNHEPRMGCWSFPSGFVDAGEDVREAAAREAFEETRITIELRELLGVYQEPGSRVVYIAYAACAGEGQPVADAESMEVRFFPTHTLPELAFTHDAEILRAWREGKGRRCKDAPAAAVEPETKPTSRD